MLVQSPKESRLKKIETKLLTGGFLLLPAPFSWMGKRGLGGLRSLSSGPLPGRSCLQARQSKMRLRLLLRLELWWLYQSCPCPPRCSSLYFRPSLGLWISKELWDVSSGSSSLVGHYLLPCGFNRILLEDQSICSFFFGLDNKKLVNERLWRQYKEKQNISK